MAAAQSSNEVTSRGIPVSPGVCRGRVVVIRPPDTRVPRRDIAEHEVKSEIRRLENAMVQTRHEINEVQRRVTEAMGAEDASIFEAHLLILEDRTLIDEVTRMIARELLNVEYAFSTVSERYAATLEAIGDDYLRERVADMRDVKHRILNNLMGRDHGGELKNIKAPCVLVAHDLTPSMTAQLDKAFVLGFCTDVGSKTSHTAIMARSLKIPAVVGLKNASSRIETGQYVLLDGYNGAVILNPSDQTLFEYGQLVKKHDKWERRLKDLDHKEATTLDGVRVVLSGNLEQPEDAVNVKEYGAEGVGLFRTEYLFINRTTLPNEEEQFEAYRKLAEGVAPDSVIIRTLDLGGDKMLSHLNVPGEMNPFLGWRAIRFCLEEKDIFRAQLRAILRASHFGKVKLMYPMISGLNELEQANALLGDCMEDLRKEQIPFDEGIEIGAMIEVPSAVMVADSIAKRVKFLSIGTNDLIQYSLAVDRLNEKIAHLYEPTHPAIVRLIKATVDAAHRHDIWVGVCGEMAGDLALIPLLLGLGIDELSVATPIVPQIKYLIRNLYMKETRELADFALNSESSTEILMRSETMARQAAPTLFELESPEDL